jgi:hypothetical protein
MTTYENAVAETTKFKVGKRQKLVEIAQLKAVKRQKLAAIAAIHVEIATIDAEIAAA